MKINNLSDLALSSLLVCFNLVRLSAIEFTPIVEEKRFALISLSHSQGSDNRSWLFCLYVIKPHSWLLCGHVIKQRALDVGSWTVKM